MDIFFYVFIFPTIVLIFLGLCVNVIFDIKNGKWSKKKPLPQYKPEILVGPVDEPSLINLPEAIKAPTGDINIATDTSPIRLNLKVIDSKLKRIKQRVKLAKKTAKKSTKKVSKKKTRKV
jgi:hypothetical protein